jgi:hypothetical protein
MQQCWMREVSSNPTVESVEATMRGRLEDLLHHIRTHPDWLGQNSLEKRIADAGTSIEDVAGDFLHESPYGSLLYSAKLCWILLPADHRDLQSLENHLRRLMERIFANTREDAEAFRFESD